MRPSWPLQLPAPLLEQQVWPGPPLSFYPLSNALASRGPTGLLSEEPPLSSETLRCHSGPRLVARVHEACCQGSCQGAQTLRGISRSQNTCKYFFTAFSLLEAWSLHSPHCQNTCLNHSSYKRIK